MPDEEIDKLVKDAADQHHPPYDDTAWGKMEVLLDKHLPQKRDRKKPVFFLLAFLLVGGAVFFAVDTAQKKQHAAITDNEGGTNPSIVAASIKETANDQATTTITANQLKTSTVNTGTPGNTGPSKNIPQKNNNSFTNGNDQGYADSRKINYDQKGRLGVKIKKPGLSSDDDFAKEKEKPVHNDIVTAENSITEKIQTTGITEDPADKKEALKTTAEKTVKVEKDPAAKNTTVTALKSKTSKTFAGKLGISLSVGADASYVAIKNPGKIKVAYGVGLNYDLGKHFTVASGLYVSKKVYNATPYEYKFPGGYVYPNLVNIAADCKVYEIPLSVYYNFKGVKNHNWLAGISLSSFLMKKEIYDYQYKTPSGQTYNYKNTVSNENKNYFSVLTLSAGYRYKLNNRLAFVAEPYVKLPLGGIGLGKIKLNSTGLLVTAVVKPFSKRKK